MSSPDPERSFNPLYDDPPPPPDASGGDPDTQVGFLMGLLLTVGLAILAGSLAGMIIKLLPDDPIEYPLLYPNPFRDVSWIRIGSGVVAGIGCVLTFFFLRNRNPGIAGVCFVVAITASLVLGFNLQ